MGVDDVQGLELFPLARGEVLGVFEPDVAAADEFGMSLRSRRRTFSTALLTRLTTWNLSKGTSALGKLAAIPLAKACDMSGLTSGPALGSPPCALRSSAKAATVEASLPGVANNTLRCSRSTKRETYL